MGLVSDFYKGQTVLITGGSGFVGKVVLARLLEQCDCRKIYVLLRQLPGGTAEDRLNTSVFTSGVFDELKRKHGASFSSFVSEKVEALAGDLLRPSLGIIDVKKVQEEVSVVIHMAASVHFNSPLKDNYRSNVEGSLRVLDFCTKCKHLQVLIHTSTCYVNSDLRGRVREGIISLPWETEAVHLAVRRLMDLTDKGGDMDFEAMEKQLLGRFPNTYAFTKRLCEALIAREWQLRNGPCGQQQQQQMQSVLSTEVKPFHFPICILRPSIIGCAYKHPKRGWMDNFNATGGMLLLCALGILQCLPANPDLIGDQVPVDVVADSLIVSGAAVAASNAALINKHHGAAAAAAAEGPAAAATRAATAHVNPSCMLYPTWVPPLAHQPPAAATAAAAAAAPAVAPLGSRDPEEEMSAAAAAGRPGVYVIHSCTSDINPTYWRDLLIHGREYNMLCPYYSRIRRRMQTPFFDTDFKKFRRRFLIQQKVPAAIMSSVVTSVMPATSKASRGMSLLYSGLLKAEKVVEALHHFSYQEWIFEQQNLPMLQKMLNAQERSTWFIGVEDINWREYIHYFFYGIARWLLQEPSACEPPPPPLLYMDALQRYLMTTPLTPPAFSLPAPEALQFVLAAPPMRIPPDAEVVEAFVLRDAALQPLIDSLAAARLERQKKKGPNQLSLEEVKRATQEEVRCLYSSMAGTIQPRLVSLLGGLFHRAFGCLFDRIIVEETQMQKLKKAVQTAPGPVMLLPTHRSYMHAFLQDFLLISFVCFTYGIAVPFIAADEAFGSISVVHRVLRRAGAFFVARGGVSRGNSKEGVLIQKLRMMLLKLFIACIARRYGVLEVFIEGGRSKTGLLLPPKRGILTTICDMVLSGPSLDVTLVPMSISYDKVLEAETFPQELLGEPKKAEALSRVLKATRLLTGPSYHQKLEAGPGSRGLPPQFGPGYRPFGTASINVMDPISFKDYLFNEWADEPSLQPVLGVLRHNAVSPMANCRQLPSLTGQPRIVVAERETKEEGETANTEGQLPTATDSYAAMRASGSLPPVPEEIKKKLVSDISNRVMDKLSEGLYITPTSLVATILALHRDGIREEDLIAQVAWLRDEVLARGGKLSPCIQGFSYDPGACVKTVLGRYLDSIAEPKGEGWSVTALYGGGGPDAQVAPLRAHLPRLLLAYYRNQCMHVFTNEAFVAVALNACSGAAAWKGGVTLQEIQTHTRFLLKLLSNHFVYSGKMNEDSIEKVVNLMEQRGVLVRHSGSGSQTLFAFNGQQEALVVLLCCFLWPFVDSIWALGNALFTLQVSPNGGVPLACAASQLRKRQLVARAHWLADGLCKQRILSFYESSSFPTIARAVDGYLAIGVLRRVDKGQNTCSDNDMLLELAPEYREEAQLQALMNQVFKFRRAAAFDLFRPDAQPIKEFTRQSLLSSFPIFARM